MDYWNKEKLEKRKDKNIIIFRKRREEDKFLKRMRLE